MNNKIKEWLPVVIIIVLIFLARMFVFSPVKVEGHSMDPSLHDNQRLITSKISFIVITIVSNMYSPHPHMIFCLKYL